MFFGFMPSTNAHARAHARTLTPTHPHAHTAHTNLFTEEVLEEGEVDQRGHSEDAQEVEQHPDVSRLAAVGHQTPHQQSGLVLVGSGASGVGGGVG